MIVGISGYAGSGKDTLAGIIQQQGGSRWEVRKFADKLKQVAAILIGCDPLNFEDQHFKRSPLPRQWSVWDMNRSGNDDPVHPVYTNDPEPRPMTVREFLQKLGTDAVRNGLHEDAWVNALMADYDHADRMPKWLVTDVRFHNEYFAIKRRGGLMIRINRGEPINSHASETALDNVQFDIEIDNTGTIEDLVDKVKLSVIPSIYQ